MMTLKFFLTTEASLSQTCHPSWLALQVHYPESRHFGPFGGNRCLSAMNRSSEFVDICQTLLERDHFNTQRVPVCRFAAGKTMTSENCCLSGLH